MIHSRKNTHFRLPVLLTTKIPYSKQNQGFSVWDWYSSLWPISTSHLSQLSALVYSSLLSGEPSFWLASYPHWKPTNLNSSSKSTWRLNLLGKIQSKGSSVVNPELFLLWWACLNHVMGHGMGYPLPVSNGLAANQTDPVSWTKQLAQWGMLILLLCLGGSAFFCCTRYKQIWSLLSAL